MIRVVIRVKSVSLQAKDPYRDRILTFFNFPSYARFMFSDPIDEVAERERNRTILLGVLIRGD